MRPHDHLGNSVLSFQVKVGTAPIRGDTHHHLLSAFKDNAAVLQFASYTSMEISLALLMTYIHASY